MRHDTAQVFVSGDRDAGGIERALHEAAHALAGAKRVALARNQDGSWGAGDYTLDVLRADSAANCTANGAADGTADFAALAQLPASYASTAPCAARSAAACANPRCATACGAR